tara:strand:+ start:318 stop:905 length:588 start_codon:yes stop_codon:yes gene_type:complete
MKSLIILLAIIIVMIFVILNFNLLDQIQETSDKFNEEKEKEELKKINDKQISDKKYVNDVTRQIHILINEQRAIHDLKSLSWNSKAAQAALNHSTDMASRNYFEHDSPEGYDFSWRYAQVGFSCAVTKGNMIYGGGENIMFLEGYYGVDKIATETVDGWMNSPGHRSNILTTHFLSEGIGVSISGNEIYVTQNFC